MTDYYFRSNSFSKLKRSPLFQSQIKYFDKITKIMTVVYIISICGPVMLNVYPVSKYDKTLSCIHLQILTCQWYNKIIFIFINIR